MVADDVAELAEQLQPQLKPARGFAPKLSHVSAAILIARDGLDSRAVCAGGRNAVPGVPEGAHDRLSKLARRILELSPELAADSRPPQPQPRRRAQQPSSASQPSVPMPAPTGLGNEPDDELRLADELNLLGLTPLQPAPDDRDEHVPMHAEPASAPSPSPPNAYRVPMPPPLAADAAPRTSKALDTSTASALSPRILEVSGRACSLLANPAANRRFGIQSTAPTRARTPTLATFRPSRSRATRLGHSERCW